MPWLAINVGVIAYALGGWPAVVGGLSGVWLIGIVLDDRNVNRDWHHPVPMAIRQTRFPRAGRRAPHP